MSLDLSIELVDNDRNPDSFPIRSFDPTQPRNQYNNMWSPMADELVRREWHLGTTSTEICKKLQVLTGFSCCIPTLNKRTAKLGLRRRDQKSDWCVGAKAMLADLWANQSIQLATIHSRINEAFGTRFTRNSIIGAAHRRGLPARTAGIVGRPRLTLEQRIANKRESRARWQNNNYDKYIGYQREYDKKKRILLPGNRERKPPRVWVEPPQDMEIPVEQRKSLMELGAHHCRYPVGDPGGPGFFFCGAELPQDRDTKRPAYCAGHASLCFRRA